MIMCSGYYARYCILYTKITKKHVSAVVYNHFHTLYHTKYAYIVRFVYPYSYSSGLFQYQDKRLIRQCHETKSEWYE